MKRKIFSLLLVLTLSLGCFGPTTVRAAQADPQVLHSRYMNDPGNYVGTIRYEYNRAGVLIREIWEAYGKEVFYDHSSNGILKNIYVYQDGENVEMKKFSWDGTGWMLWEANVQGELILARDQQVTLDACGRPLTVTEQRIYDDEIWGETHTYTYYEATEPEIGDLVTFGTYEQDNEPENGQEPIEWQILDKQEDRLLLISTHALDSQRYHKENVSVTWKDCSVRTWLNDYFCSMAFTDNQKEQILETTVEYNAGSDKLFFLSQDQVNQYFPDQGQRCSLATDYAVAQGAYVDSAGRSWWLLRTSAASANYVMSINCDGSIDLDGGRVASDRGTIRPAMWVRAEAVTGRDAPVKTEVYTDYYVTGETRVEHCRKVYEYDADGHLLSCSQDLSDGSERDDRTTNTYDDQGNLTKTVLRYSDNYNYTQTRTITYQNTYDNQNRLIRVEESVSEVVRRTGEPMQFSGVKPNGVTTYQYDAKGNLTQQKHTFADGATDYVTVWQYDAQGNVLKITRNGTVIEQNTYGPLSKAQWN